MMIHAETQTETILGAEPTGFAPLLLDDINEELASSYRAEIGDLQAVINSSKTDTTLIEPFILQLGESLSAVVSIGDGSLGINMPRQVEDFARAGSLIEDYGVHSSEAMHRIVIPIGRITAINALAFPVVGRDYRPVVDMRVQTSHDKPLQVHKAPETPNPGKWHRFPLSLVGFSFEN